VESKPKISRKKRLTTYLMGHWQIRLRGKDYVEGMVRDILRMLK